MASTIRIATRPSRLALAQAAIVKARLNAIAPGLTSEIVPIRTSGDRMATASLAQVGGKGLFIKELEQALNQRRVEIAVHSMKDLPARLGAEFRIAAVLEREDPRDALIARLTGGLGALPPGARLGTSSARRRFEALRARPDLKVSALRGNVDTRLQKLARGELDAIIVAISGLKRLGRMDGLNCQVLDEREFVPAGGQGALAVEALAERPAGAFSELERALEQLNESRAAAETAAERAFLATLGASCVSPVGVLARLEGEMLSLTARLFSVDGCAECADALEERCEAAAEAAAALGVRLAKRMIERGAAALIGGAE